MAFKGVGAGYALYWKIVDAQRAIDRHYDNCKVCVTENDAIVYPCLATQELLADRNDLINGPILGDVEEVDG